VTHYPSGMPLRLLPLLLCLCMPLQAAPSLGQLIESALARQPGGERAESQRAVALALRRKAEQPLADAPRANVKYQTDLIGSDLGYREWEGGVELPLWLPGQADSFAREAAGHSRLSEALEAARRLEISGEVRERLWAAAIAYAEADQARAARDSAQSLFEDVQRRVAAGELPRSDRLLAEKEVLAREQSLTQALSRAAEASLRFSRYAGAQPPADPAAETPAREEGWSAQHPQLRLAHWQVQRARAHRDRISRTAQEGPSLWLGGKTTRAVAGGDYDSSLGVEISLPLGAGAYRAPDLAEAEQLLTEALVEEAHSTLALEDAVSMARHELERTQTALQQTQRQRTLSDQSLALSRRAFELGETDLVRLLQAQQDALSARYEHQLSRLRHALAVARLNQALGVVPR